MTQKFTSGTEFPEQFRNMTQSSVEQARKAFEDMVSNTQRAIDAAEGGAQTMQSSAREMNRMTLSFSEEVVNASFDLMESMAKAKDPKEIVELQQKFMQRHMQRLGEQARVFGETAVKSAQDMSQSATRPGTRK